MSEELTDDFILDLLNEKKERPYYDTQFPEEGPVRSHDTYYPNKSLRCRSKGCGCPTVFSLRGIPYCTIHLIIRLNLEVIEHDANRSPNESSERADETSGQSDRDSGQGTQQRILNL